MIRYLLLVVTFPALAASSPALTASSPALAASSPALAASSSGDQLSKLEFATQFKQNLEQSFGLEIGAIQVHIDDKAATACAQVEARADTSGSSVVFKEGEYVFASGAVHRLLSHEVAHMVESRTRCPENTEPVFVK